ncbi:MAG TPA: AraC family transcriptional regulator [Noviherbaspirillum sp.]|uniref:AraC family transcriptional regulator n=1 Tax=Noviherbaspirillum sp. TaxID=1926288 RepID=UPI002B46F745|nr:AraC family transcriptional regulator [Noviherbaspirillum sp.]HJV86263.1 AraC family transcriptional regulator [Noviherbaspirillum sp.]
MDALSEVLRVVQLNGAVFLNAEFTAPWCVTSKAENELCAMYLPEPGRVLSYHLITGGSCWVSLAGNENSAIRVEAGELLVVPQGELHVLGSELTTNPVPSGPLLSNYLQAHPGEVMAVNYGGGGLPTRMVCGFIACDAGLSNPLLASLPRLFKVDVGQGIESAWLASALSFAAAEAADPRTGTTSVLAKLSELLFVHAIRRYIDTLPESEKGWLAAVRDRYVGRALSHLHARPAHPWTVEELAGHIGLSRSAFAQRFTDLLGQPPMQYLAHWRLCLAARLLSGGRPLAEVAGTVGYDSEAAFSRAFKREFGHPPGSWRTIQASSRMPRSTAS